MNSSRNINNEIQNAVIDYDRETLTLEEKKDRDDYFDINKIGTPISSRVIDLDVFSLTRRLTRGTITIPNFDPSSEKDSKNQESHISNFQRKFVWKKSQIDKFLETIFLKFPIPGIILIDQKLRDSENWLVLDGQQRLTSLRLFLYEKHRIGNSEDIVKEFRGKTFDELEIGDRDRFENYTISVTVIDAPEANDLDYIYQIFERINSGGTQLTAHEIRIALYSGEFANHIEELNNFQPWRKIYGDSNSRLRDHELVSRILAMYINWESYTKPLKGFLNDFYKNNRNHWGDDVNKAESLFLDATRLLDESLGRWALRRGNQNQINVASSEAVYVGLMNRLNSNSAITAEEIKEKFKELHQDENFNSYISGATTDEYYVKSRISIAINKFSN